MIIILLSLTVTNISTRHRLKESLYSSIPLNFKHTTAIYSISVLFWDNYAIQDALHGHTIIIMIAWHIIYIINPLAKL